MVTTIKSRLDELKRQLGLLPEIREPPLTLLQVLDRSHQEQDWQKLLFYFLSPDEPHGLEHALLDYLLTALSEREELQHTFSRFDLMNVQVKQEVSTNQGRPDGIVWSPEEWFICWELKINAIESQGQTQGYVDVESFRGIGLVKDNVPPDKHFYIFLAPADADPPKANEFIQISWEWIALKIQSFVAESHGEYPARTMAQLNDFVGTIRSELEMTEYQENEQEMAEMFVEYYHEISEVENAFEKQWEGFTNDWGTQLAQSVEKTNFAENLGLVEKYPTLDIDIQDGQSQKWIFRQGMSDWGGILKEGWWKRTDDLSNIYEIPDDGKLAGVSLYHRLENNRDLAIENKMLEIEFWHSASNTDRFVKQFNRNFEEMEAEIKRTCPSSVKLLDITDSKKLFTASYEIHRNKHDNFFQAYTEALKEAFVDLVIENNMFITTIDEVYEQSIEMYQF